MSIGSMYSNKRAMQLPEQRPSAPASAVDTDERTRLENEVFAERMRLAKTGQTDDVVRGT